MPTPVRTTLACATAIIALGAVTGCGSTVSFVADSARTGELSGGLNDGLDPTSDPVLPAPSSIQDPALPRTGSPIPGAPQDAKPQSPGQYDPATASPPTLASGRGFTATTVQIGVATAADSGAFAGSFGVSGTGQAGDPMAQLNAVVADVNRHGGLVGRKVVLVPHDYNTSQTLSNPGAANQQACDDWTQDHKVFAVVAAPVVEDTLLTCLAKTRTPLIQAGGLDFPNHYRETYDKFPLLFNLAQMDGDHYDQISIDRLAARQFFDPWDTRRGSAGNATNPMKLAILGFDDHTGELQLKSLAANLARHAIKATDVIRCPRALQENITCMQSAVLRMRSDGITHIFGGNLITMQTANTQGFHPRYFLAYEPRLFAANAPKEQLIGSMGESYIPAMDVEPSEYPGDPTKATTHCRQVMRAAGQATSDPTTLWGQLILCDVFYFLQSGVNTVGSLGPEAVRSGLESLGTRVPSALTWGTLLSRNSHASATVVRDLEFRSATKRFAYVNATNYAAK